MEGGVLITGGTGSFGQAFTAQLLRDKTRRICIYSRSEHAQALMARKFAGESDRLRFFIGDVRDVNRLKRACLDIHTIIHAAALKRIEVGHYNPEEMIKTNVIGSMNVVDAALDVPVKKVVLLSSDKAWQPISPYGRCKALAEDLFINANNMRGWDGPSFAVCRYGNVWNSAGSVVPVWRAALAAGEPIKITDPECTRFYMKMDEAIQLVLDTCQHMKPLNIPKLPAYRLGDLADAIMGPLQAQTVTGLPAWEKLHEGMADGNTSDRARRMTMAELKAALDETA